MRQFDTGAIRDTDDGKFDYEGFISPLVLRRYAEYMHENRVQTDGNLRDSDNWQKGIPEEAYMKSKFRHFMETWLHHRGLGDLSGLDLERALCAELFNTMGYLHTVLEARRSEPREVHTPEPIMQGTQIPDTNLSPSGDDKAPTPSTSTSSRGAQMRKELGERNAAAMREAAQAHGAGLREHSARTTEGRTYGAGAERATSGTVGVYSG